LPKKKSLPLLLRKNKAFVFSTILTIVLFLFAYCSPSVIVVIQKEIVYRTLMGPITGTATLTFTVSTAVTVTRTNATAENVEIKLP